MKTLRMLWTACRHAIGIDEIAVTLALALIAAGFWSWWRPGAFLVPGVVLLWLCLPARSVFIIRPKRGERDH